MFKLTVEEREELRKKRTACNVMTRVTGWFVNKSAFNPGKAAEDNDRVHYKIKE
jgi:hypothetical protein